MRLNLGIRRRLAPLMDNDHRKIMLANALLYSLPGAPIIYYGDEIGMGDNIWLPDRNGVRTPMQWNSGPNAGFSDAPPELLYTPVITDSKYSYKIVNVAVEESDPNSLLSKMKHLVRIRKENPILAAGSYEFLAAEVKQVLTIHPLLGRRGNDLHSEPIRSALSSSNWILATWKRVSAYGYSHRCRVPENNHHAIFDCP